MCVVVVSMVHDAALPKAKQHGIKVAKAKREEMHKQAHAAEEAKHPRASEETATANETAA